MRRYLNDDFACKLDLQRYEGNYMAFNLYELVNMQDLILAFEFTYNGKCASYGNVTREMAAISHSAHLLLTRAVRRAYGIN